MNTNDLPFHDAVPPGPRGMLPHGIPGIIDGSMTVHLQPGGGLSLRVVTEADSGHVGQGDLLDLIIGAEHIEELGRILAGCSAEISEDSYPAPSFPCHIGYCRNIAVTNTADSAA